MLGRISPSRIFGPRDAERLGGGDEVALHDRLRGTARDARHARHRRQSDGQHDQPVLGAERRDRDEREHDLRERQDDVHDRASGRRRASCASRRRRGRRARRARGRAIVAIAATASSWPPPQRNRLQTSWPMWSVPKSRFDGPRVGLADEGRRRVRGEVRPDHRDRRRARATMREADAGAPEAERAAQQAPGRPARAAASVTGAIGGVGDRAHSRVLSRGVTRIVAMSASRLSTT